MKNFMKTILSGVQAWTRGEIRKSTADWNQNDQNADNYIKNRTHWEEKATKEESFMIAKEFDLSEEGYLEWANIPMLTAGQKYVVDWNGERYECLAKLDSYGVTVYLGNPHLGEWYENPASSEPFFIATFSREQWSMICCEPGTYTVEILLPAGRTIIHKLDKKFIDLPENLATIDDVEEAYGLADEAYHLADNAYYLATEKMDQYNPTGSGSFSMNRKSGTNIGYCSHAEGYDNAATANYSHAEGYYTWADGQGSHAEGYGTSIGINRATGNGSHVEGGSTEAHGEYSHAEGQYTTSVGYASHSSGEYNIAAGRAQFVSGRFSIADLNENNTYVVYTKKKNDDYHMASNMGCVGDSYTFNEKNGLFTLTGNVTKVGNSSSPLVKGKYFSSSSNNSEKDRIAYITTAPTSSSSFDFYADELAGRLKSNENLSTFAHIVGNGAHGAARSNAHTLDWEGNAWYSGDVYVGSTSGTNRDEGSKKLATEEFVNTALESAAVVQPDWEQNDSTADDYIKNRPFYTQNGRVALVDNLTRENYENDVYPVCNFVPGQSYDVVWDGVLYENIICIDDDGWNVILGDMFYIDDDGGNGLYIEGFEEDWSTLSIFTTQEVVKKIDEKYLPNVRKVLKLYTCYSEDADDSRAGGTPALAPDKILRAGSANWEDYVTVEALANADDIVIFEGQTKVGVPANITFCTRFDDYYNTSTEYAIITFYSEHEGKIRTMWSRESNLDEYLATQDYVDAEISKISAISLTENLTDSEKKEVRDNIGAGTSNFSGSYNDLTDKPDLGQQELITPEDIDVICGQSIELASEVSL